MSPLQTLRRQPRRVQVLTITAAVVTVAAWAVLAYLFANRTTQTDQMRRDQRQATVLLGHGVCSAFAVLEQAAAKPTSGKPLTAEQSKRLREFFLRFYAPIDQALLRLDATPCPKDVP